MLAPSESDADLLVKVRLNLGKRVSGINGVNDLSFNSVQFIRIPSDSVYRGSFPGYKPCRVSVQFSLPYILTCNSYLDYV